MTAPLATLGIGASLLGVVLSIHDANLIDTVAFLACAWITSIWAYLDATPGGSDQ